MSNIDDFFANYNMGTNPDRGEDVRLYRPAARELLWFIEWLAKNRLDIFDEAGTHPAQHVSWIANLKAALGDKPKE